MNDANLGVAQRGMSTCKLSQVAESREKNNEGGFPMPRELPNMKRCVKEWNNSDDGGALFRERVVRGFSSIGQ